MSISAISGCIAPRALDGLGPGLGEIDPVSPHREEQAERLAHVGIVFDDEHAPARDAEPVGRRAELGGSRVGRGKCTLN